VPPHPDLENLAYGDQAMREWKQYVLPDRNTALHGNCPLHIAKRHDVRKS
jgi:FPC/CPF motif-containing protein YcgG